MTQEEKQLIFKDLCARLPYGIRYKGDGGWGINPYQHSTSLCTILTSEEPLVYLRPMSSMDEIERGFFRLVSSHRTVPDGFGSDVEMYSLKCIDWLNAHHFDYRGLIPRGLALEAPKDMYETE